MAKNTIKLKKYLDVVNEFTATAVAITPGMLLELTSAELVQAHSTEGGPVLPMFALEDELQGKGITDNYAVSAKIQVWTAVRGEEVYALLADGEDVAVGDFLISDGTGKLKAATADSSAVVVEEFPIAIALEAVDMSGSSGADPSGRIKVVIL
jgi:hypothetical protein